MTLPRTTQTVALILVAFFSSLAGAQYGTLKLKSPQGVAVDAAGDILVVQGAEILRVDPTTGDREIASDDYTGLGQPFGQLEDIAIDAAGQLVVTDSQLGGILRVDPMFGHRTVLTAPTLGSGPALSAVQAVAVEASGTLVVVENDYLSGSAVMRVDPVTGDRTVISHGLTGIGNGPTWIDSLSGIAVGPNDQLFVGAANSPLGNAIFQVDPVSGDRTVLINATAQFPFGPPRALAFDSNGDLLLLAGDNGVNQVLHIDMTTASATVVTGAPSGTGPVLAEPIGLAAEAVGTIIVTDEGRDAVLRVDPATGARSFIAITGTRYAGFCMDAPRPLSEGTKYFYTYNQPGQAAHPACGSGGTTTWFEYVPTVSNVVEISVLDTGSNNVLTVFTGPCSALSALACNSGTSDTHVELYVEAGETYRIQLVWVASTTGGGGRIRIRRQATTDECADAHIVAPGSLPFHNLMASDSTAPLPTVCSGPQTGSFERDVWARFVAPQSGETLIAACGYSENELAIYSGDCGNLVDVTCDRGSCGIGSKVQFSATAGESYLIRIGAGANAMVGLGTLTIQSLGPQCYVSTGIPSDAVAGDRHGSSVAVDGATAIAGSYNDSSLASEAGAAYIYQRVGADWSVAQELLASDGAAGDFFGYSVDIQGDVAVVGAYNHDVAGVANAGAAYVFRRGPAGWQEEAKLVAPVRAAHDLFGIAVAIDAGRIVVGKPSVFNTGSAYVFAFDGTHWVEEQELVAAGSVGDRFGDAVGIHGDVIVVGDTDYGGPASPPGAVYVFRKLSGSWVEEQLLVAADGSAYDRFGESVSVDGNLIVVGAPTHDSAGHNTGAAYVFRDNGSSWAPEQKLLAGAPQAYDNFGISVSVSGERVLVGAKMWGLGGAAYAFDYSGTEWTQTSLHLGPTGVQGDSFGQAVEVDGESFIVGAPTDASSGSHTGAVYFFGSSDPLPPTDLTCTLVQMVSMIHFEATWTNNGTYSGISMVVDGNAQLLDGSATSYVENGAALPPLGAYEICFIALNACGEELPPICCTVHVSRPFVRGDCNDSGAVNLPDAVAQLSVLFSGGATTCLDACDANGNGNFNLADAVHVLSFLFSGGTPPATPFPLCGADHALGCNAYTSCP